MKKKIIWCLFLGEIENRLITAWRSKPSLPKLHEFCIENNILIEKYQIKALRLGHPVTFGPLVYTLSPIEEGKLIQVEKEEEDIINS